MTEQNETPRIVTFAGSASSADLSRYAGRDWQATPNGDGTYRLDPINALSAAELRALADQMEAGADITVNAYSELRYEQKPPFAGYMLIRTEIVLRGEPDAAQFGVDPRRLPGMPGVPLADSDGDRLQ